jgi:hypothetical protein
MFSVLNHPPLCTFLLHDNCFLMVLTLLCTYFAIPKWPISRRQNSKIAMQRSDASILQVNINRGIIWIFFFVLYSTLLHLPLLRFYCVGGCWDRTVATSALAVRRSNQLARSNIQSARSARYHPQSARSHPHSARSHPPSRLDLIHPLG